MLPKCDTALRSLPHESDWLRALCRQMHIFLARCDSQHDLQWLMCAGAHSAFRQA